MVVGVAFLGCGDNGGDTATDGGATDSGATDNEAPLWSRIPTQAWIVGVPIYIDLMDYVTDPDGDALAFSLDQPLPDGVTLNGSVISGTPSAATPSAQYMVTADDGTG